MKNSIILTVAFCVFTCVIYARVTEKKGTWDYPVKPGTEAWGALKTYEEQLNAYNIPVEMVKKISTRELVKICLSYPEWGVINAFNDRRIGLNNMMSQFNGFYELFARNDAAKELIKVYSNLNPLAVGKDWTLLQQGNFGFSINCIELLLSHSMMLEKLDWQDTRVLLDEVVLKYNSKKQLPDVYSLWDLSPTAGLCLSIVDKDEKISKNDANLQSLKRTFMAEDIKILNSVFELIKK